MLGCIDQTKVIGPVKVFGLERALDTNADLEISGLEPDATHWLDAWAATLGSKRDLIIRDNQEDRWFYVRGAFITRYGQNQIYPVVVNEVSLENDEPSWWQP